MIVKCCMCNINLFFWFVTSTRIETHTLRDCWHLPKPSRVRRTCCWLQKTGNTGKTHSVLTSWHWTAARRRRSSEKHFWSYYISFLDPWESMCDLKPFLPIKAWVWMACKTDQSESFEAEEAELRGLVVRTILAHFECEGQDWTTIQSQL